MNFRGYETTTYLGVELVVTETWIKVYKNGRLISTESSMSGARRFVRGYRKESRTTA